MVEAGSWPGRPVSPRSPPCRPHTGSSTSAAPAAVSSGSATWHSRRIVSTIRGESWQTNRVY